MAVNDAIKEEVLRIIANRKPFAKALGKGQGKWCIGTKVIHMRFRTSAKSDGVSYAYNINPNTLEADYEVWICGTARLYYLIPMFEIRSIYDDPDAYVDYQYPDRRVADVNTQSHRVLYGRGSQTKDFDKYFRAILKL